MQEKLIRVAPNKEMVGNLTLSITNGCWVDYRNRVMGTNRLSLKIAPSTGLFHGSVINPATGRPIAVNGAVLQKQNAGFGNFLGINRSGLVYLGPE